MGTEPFTSRTSSRHLGLWLAGPGGHEGVVDQYQMALINGLDQADGASEHEQALRQGTGSAADARGRGLGDPARVFPAPQQQQGGLNLFTEPEPVPADKTFPVRS